MDIGYSLSSTGKQSGIYMIKNIVNEKVYIGSSINLYNRLYNHLSSLRKGDHFSNHLQMSFNKYGENNFMFTVLYEDKNTDVEKEALTKSLLIKEKEFIEQHKATDKDFGYNKNSNPELPPMLNRKHSDESREIMSKRQMGELNHNFGKSPSDTTRERMSASRGSKPRAEMTNEIKSKISQTMKLNGNRPSDEAIAKSLLARQKKVVQLTTDGETVAEFNSLKEASETTGFRASDIGACCRGRQKTCKGYIWEYKES